MVWFKVDDKFGEHPKVRAIPRACRGVAIGLWTLAGTWCASNVTATEAQDGNVPAYMLDELGFVFTDAAELVRVRLWHTAGHDCPDCPQPRDSDGYVYHQWHTHQYTREQVLEKRANDAERQRQARARRKQEREGSSSQDRHAVTFSDDSVSHGTVQLSRPDPTRPDPELITEGGQRTETLRASETTEPTQEPRCTRHEGIADPGPCRGCMRAREAAENAAAAEAAAKIRARLDCKRCGGTSWLETSADEPAQKCDHAPLTTLEIIK